MAKTLFIEMGT